MPDGLAPKVRTCAEASPVALVTGGLCFFGMEVSVGLVGIVERPTVLIDRSSGTIFRHADRRSCSFFLGIVEELVSLADRVAVPAEVFVPSQEVGDAEVEFRIDAGGKGRQS